MLPLETGVNVGKLSSFLKPQKTCIILGASILNFFLVDSANVDLVKITVKQKQTARRSMVRGRGYQPELQISGNPKDLLQSPARGSSGPVVLKPAGVSMTFNQIAQRDMAEHSPRSLFLSRDGSTRICLCLGSF